MTERHPDVFADGDCERFDVRLLGYLERDLDAGTMAWMEQHRNGCTMCAAVVREYDALVVDAKALSSFPPSRDLWSGISARLETPVVPLNHNQRAAHDAEHRASTPSTRSTQHSVRGVRVRTLAIAATMLVAVSSAITWQVTRHAGVPTTNTDVAASGTAVSFDTVLDGTDVRPVANLNVVYQTEIDGLRAVVNERYAELDTNTVEVLKRNLLIIDQAIADCRQALATDPNSRILTTTLDRALASKLALMRQVALL